MIENTFLIFSQRRGFNRNLTARSFRTSFRFQAAHNLMKSTDLSHCEINYDYNLLDLDSQNSLSSSENSKIIVNSDSCSLVSSPEESNLRHLWDDNEQKIT